ncbi:hypothetical protein DFH07DRAFT_766227 [Mycena maculata]|uniref:Uncharacterized protein n=1 Tax=Mycena maculata TaxID=230809 RepID=A0AAD7NWL0_9AGAR|nr:hypothetical protein DFH07DRAFT_766227 [Mycena maculata]
MAWATMMASNIDQTLTAVAERAVEEPTATTEPQEMFRKVEEQMNLSGRLGSQVILPSQSDIPQTKSGDLKISILKLCHIQDGLTAKIASKFINSDGSPRRFQNVAMHDYSVRAEVIELHIEKLSYQNHESLDGLWVSDGSAKRESEKKCMDGTGRVPLLMHT